MVSKIPAFWNEDFSVMVSSSGLPDCQLNHTDNNGVLTDTAFLYSQHSQEDCQNLEEVGIGKNRRSLESHSLSIAINKSVEGGTPKNPSGDMFGCLKEQDKKKHKTEQNDSASLKSSGEPQKENYVHVRAKRGQATNSHSLAERVRREKISERMRLLQELVPGCNKITGKAVMLDEVINYVQSLQQQVEFLSMKLATANPEMNLDVEQILSKDILLPGLNFSHNISHRSFTCIPGTNPLHALPQNVWDNDMQTILQKGFDSIGDQVIDSLVISSAVNDGMLIKRR